MNKKIAVVTILICLLFWGVVFYRRQGKKRDIPVLISFEEQMPGLALPTISPQNEIWYMEESFKQRKAEISGREDPFADLPVDVMIEESQTEGKASGPTTPEPQKYFVRGIFMGKNPAAMIEEPGGYRKVKVGDHFAGGKIVAINEAGVIIERRGKRITININLGE